LAASYVKASQRDMLTHLCSRGHEIGDIMKKRAHTNTASMLNASVAILMLAFWVTPCIKQKDQDRLPIPQDNATGASGSSNDLELELSLAQKVYQIRTPILLEALFRNRGKTPLTVVNMVDGSIEGMRYPKYEIHLVSAEGQAVTRKRNLRCGNVNPLFEGDMIQVMPQQTVDPFAPIDEYHFRAPIDIERMYDITKPGQYRVWLQYSYTDSDQVRIVKCVYQSEAMARIYKTRSEQLRHLHIPMPDVPPLEVDRLTSNEVVFEIVP
jgi:hypothetical protein